MSAFFRNSIALARRSLPGLSPATSSAYVATAVAPPHCPPSIRPLPSAHQRGRSTVSHVPSLFWTSYKNALALATAASTCCGGTAGKGGSAGLLALAGRVVGRDSGGAGRSAAFIVIVPRMTANAQPPARNRRF